MTTTKESTSATHTQRGESDADRQARLDRDKQKEMDEYEKDPAKATRRGEQEAFDRMKEAYGKAGLKEDINSMVHPDADDPVEPRGSGKPGIPAGTEDYEKAVEKSHKATKQRLHGAVSDRSTDPDDKNAAVTVDPTDGTKRTKDGVK